MNENVNLVEILKDCPKGTKLYSTIYGDVELVKVYLKDDNGCPIEIKIGEGSEMICDITNDGRLLGDFPGECTLFPSKKQRDWHKFNVKSNNSKFDPRTLNTFDKVLVKTGTKRYHMWLPDFISMPPNDIDEAVLCMTTNDVVMAIPYNEETKCLVGTNKEAPEFYRYWEK